MNATARNITRRITRALWLAAQLSTDVLYALINGAAIQRLLNTGDLITVNTILDRLGVDADFKDGYRSWTGRHIAQAYRVANHRAPIRAWVRHRTSGRWIHVFVYCPGDTAIAAGLRTYSRTAHLATTPARSAFAEAA